MAAPDRSRRLSHIGPTGRPRMVDVSAKPESAREATAKGSVYMSPETLSLIVSGKGAKGDVLTTAQIAGIMAAKRTHELIPLCHPLPLTGIEVSLEPNDGEDGRGDGGANGGVGRGADGVRHGEGSAEGHAHRRHPPRPEDGWEERGHRAQVALVYYAEPAT